MAFGRCGGLGTRPQGHGGDTHDTINVIAGHPRRRGGIRATLEYILPGYTSFRLWFGGKSQSLTDLLIDVLGLEQVKKTIEVVAVEFRTITASVANRGGGSLKGSLRAGSIGAQESLHLLLI